MFVVAVYILYFETHNCGTSSLVVQLNGQWCEQHAVITPCSNHGVQ